MDADLPFVQGRPERFGIKPDAGAHHEEPKKPNRSTGVVSTVCREGNLCNWGKPGAGGCDSNATLGVAASLGLGEGHSSDEAG